jgi:RNA polymerase sigma-70 factor (ECF subfamily)
MKPSLPEDDVDLLRRIATGDGDALARLFDLHSPVALGLLVRMLGDRAEAEEVLQEAFLQVWMQADRYDPERSSPRGWVLMLARSRALDHLRRRAARRRREDESAEEEARLSLVQPEGTARLEAAERQSRISSALSLLSPDQRHCIELAFFEGLTHSQIAERLKAPLGTVKSRILLGMSKLRQALSAS